MNRRALGVDELSAGYIPGMSVIREISIRVEPEEIVCVVGPNGAGKSTLMKSIAGLLHIDQGSVILGSSTITNVRPDALAQSGIAYVPQLDNIFRTMSIEQNLALAARRCKTNHQLQIDSMISRFPVLQEKLTHKAGSLSGGQRQFLALAMALIGQPSLLLLDEPSAGLAPKATEEVLGMLRGIAASGVAILMVEQNVKAALSAADRAYVLADGQKQHEADARKLLSDPVLGEIYLGARRTRPYAAKSV